MDKNDIEALANERFGKSVAVASLNRLEASDLLEELLDTYGNKG